MASDRYIDGYEAGYAAATRDRQNEIDFLMRLIERNNPREVVIPFKLSEETKELFKKKISEHDMLKAFQEHEEKQNEAAKRFKAALDSNGLAVSPDGGLYYGME